MGTFAIFMATIGLACFGGLVIVRLLRWLVEGGSIQPADAVDRLGAMVDDDTRDRLRERMWRAR